MAVNDSSGVNTTDDVAIANAFNKYFASVGVKSNRPNCTPNFPARNIPKLNSVDIVPQDVSVAIKKLKSNLSAGPDGLPPLLFERVKILLSHSKPLLLHSSLVSSTQLLFVAFVLDVRKSTPITPVHKRGPQIW